MLASCKIERNLITLLLVLVLTLVVQDAKANPVSIKAVQPVIKVASPSDVAEVGEGRLFTLEMPRFRGVVKYRWDLDNDGTPDRHRRVIVIKYRDNGLKTIHCSAINLKTHKRVFNEYRNIQVTNAAPTVFFGAPVTGRQGESIKFRASASDPSRIDRASGFTYIWDFGDGSPKIEGVNEAVQHHSYQEPGVYQVTLQVIDKDGAVSNVVSDQVIVAPLTNHPSENPQASPTSSPLQPSPSSSPVKPGPTPTLSTVLSTPTPQSPRELPSASPTPTSGVKVPQPTPTATVAPLVTPTPKSVVATPTPKPVVATPTPTPKPVAATPTPTPIPKPPAATPTPTPKPPVATPTPTPKPPLATPTPKPPVATPTPATLVRVNPLESSAILSNPDMGWESVDQVESDGVDLNGFPIKVAYVKYYWKNLEPSDGVFDFTVFDLNLKHAHAAGQKVAIRIVVVDDLVSAPAWLQAAGARGYSFRYDENGKIANALTVWGPDNADPIFQQRHFQFLQELGRRYNGHPDITSVDIGTVGLWGEWHYWGTSPAVPMPNNLTAQKIIDKYFEVFPNTPLVAQLDPPIALQYAVSRGAGYRGDCLGFIDNQMALIYDPNIAAAKADSAWKKAPVQFEACWNISYWVQHGFNLRYIFDWALTRHTSYFNNKNSAVPVSALPEVQRFLKKMGYRLVLRELRHAVSVKAGLPLVLSMDWDNIGVAPAYGNYVLGVQFRNAAGAAVLTVATTQTIKNWMPGPFLVDQSIAIPATLAPGKYTVALSILNPSTKAPAVQLAITGRDATGWYPLSSVNVQ